MKSDGVFVIDYCPFFLIYLYVGALEYEYTYTSLYSQINNGLQIKLPATYAAIRQC
jgi:hypothetical protein